MDRIAFVFPGQGSQSVGMGKALAEASPAAAAVMAEADAALGESISHLAFDGPAEQLDLTVNAQPAIVAVSVAFLAALRERWAHAGIAAPSPAFAAGHSLGQYSAMVAAGVLTLADAVRLVRERGLQMQASGQGRTGAMAAIIGLDDSRIPELLALGAADGSVTVANRNSPGQIVISGDRAAVEAAAAGAKELGARRGIVLPVSVAAHSASWPRPPGAWPASWPPSRSPIRRRASRQRGRTTRHHRRGGARRTDRTPDPRRRLGRRRQPDDRRGRHHLRGSRPGQGPDRPHQANRPRSGRLRDRRTLGRGRHRRAVHGRGPANDPPAAIPRAATSQEEPNPVRKPDYTRRIAVTGLGVVSPIGNDVDTVWDSLTTAAPASGGSPISTPAPTNTRSAAKSVTST